MIQFAMQKLNGFASLDKSSAEATFAALSIRHLLTFEKDHRAPDFTTKDHRTALSKETRQVASHMRIIHSVPEHREYTRTGTPSEPILAEAAAQLLEGGDQVKALAEATGPLVEKGERGELAARLLLNLAHDAALPPQTSESTGVRYAQPILFLDFFKALFTEQWFEKILLSSPVAGGDTSFEATLKDCYIHFTH